MNTPLCPHIKSRSGCRRCCLAPTTFPGAHRGGPGVVPVADNVITLVSKRPVGWLGLEQKYTMCPTTCLCTCHVPMHVPVALQHTRREAHARLVQYRSGWHVRHMYASIPSSRGLPRHQHMTVFHIPLAKISQQMRPYILLYKYLSKYNSKCGNLIRHSKYG